MSREIVEKFYGKRSVFEVVKVRQSFGGAEFWVYKDGNSHRGAFSDLRGAVRVAKEEADK